MIGNVKLEDTIKCKGHPFEYVNETRIDVAQKPIIPTKLFTETNINMKRITHIFQKMLEN